MSMVASRDRYRWYGYAWYCKPRRNWRENTLRLVRSREWKWKNDWGRKRDGNEEITLRGSSTLIEQQNLNSEKKKDEFKRSKQNLLLCAGSAVNTLMVSGYPVLDGQSRSQFTSSSASTTLSLAAIGLHNEETVSHTLPHCAANAGIASNVIVRNLYRASQRSYFQMQFEERDWNLRSPISQSKWRSNNIAPFSIIEWYYFVQALRINFSASEIYLYLK